ncbi:MAG: DUF805 domain-containing protein [Clostridium sp.]
MSDNLFLLNKKIGRKKYIIYVMTFIIGIILLRLLVSHLAVQAEKTGYELLIASLMSLQITLKVFLNIILVMLSYKRFEDINLSGFWGIFSGIKFIQIPIIIALMCITGKEIIEKEKLTGTENSIQSINDDTTITLYSEE